MASRLHGKVAIVTGSGRGIGKIDALALAREGASVITNSRNRGSPGGDAATTAEEIIKNGGTAEPFFGDVSDFQVAGELIRTALGSFGAVHILVNNAGISRHAEPWNISEKNWDEVINVCLKSAFNCTHHACVPMRDQRWGRIINVTSGAWIALSNAVHYAAAKAGIVGLTRGLAMDLGKYGITCNAYHPYARTAMLDMSDPDRVKRQWDRFEQGKITKEELEWHINPPGPESIGELVAYLASDDAARINGKVFYISGGKVGIYTEPVKKKMIFKETGYWSVSELVQQVPGALMKE